MIALSLSTETAWPRAIMAKWEARGRLRYGSEHKGFWPSKKDAEEFAWLEIRKHGNEGRIDYIDRAKRIIYYDVYPELT